MIVIKIFRKIALIVVIVIALIPVAAWLALQLPSTQTALSKRAARVLSQKLNTEVSVEKVYFVFFKKLILGNVQIFSSPTDTLLHANKLSVTLTHFNPFASKASLQRVLLQGGVFHLEIEERQTNLERVFKIQKGRRDERDTIPPPFELSLTDFSLKDFRFTLKNERRSRQVAFPTVMDFSNLDVSHINIDVTNVRFENGVLSCTLKNLTGKEKSGYIINGITGNVTVSGRETRVLNLVARDPWSEVKADRFSMHYNSAKDFRSFVDSVRLEANFTRTLLSFCSLSYYAPALENNRLSMYISGHAEGPVRNLMSNGMIVESVSGATSVDVDFRVRGLPDVSITTAFLDIHRLHSQVGDLAQILFQINGTNPDQITQLIPPPTSLKFEGRLAGLLTNFAANGALATDMGSLYFDTMLHQEKGEGFHINGRLETKELNLEPIMGRPFGALTMYTHTHAILKSALQGGVEAKIDSLRINKIVINDYPFSHIFAVGSYGGHRFDGRVVCSDPNLNFIFQGLANLNYREFQPNQTARYDFHTKIGFADLAAIGIDARDSVSLLSGSIRANFQRSVEGDVVGTIMVQEADYTNSLGKYNLGAIHIDSHVRDSSYRFELSAPFAKADYTGSEGITKFIKDLRHHALSRYLPNFFVPVHVESPCRQYHLDVTILDMLAIGQLALPGLFIAPGTHLTASLGSNDLLSCFFHSKYIRYREQKANNISINYSGNDLKLNSKVSATDLYAFGQLIDTVSIQLETAQNNIDARLDYTNWVGENSGGEVNAHIFFGEAHENGGPNIAVNVKPSHFIINRQRWELDPSEILINPKNIQFQDLTLHNFAQSLTVNGVLDKEQSDTLHLALHQFDFSLVNLFLKKSPYRFSGLLTGDAQVIDFYGNRQFSMDVKGTNLFVNEHEGGEITLACIWDHPTQRFRIDAQNMLQGKTPVLVGGFYYPDNKYLNLNAEFKNFSVTYFEPFLGSMVSNMDGTISGSANLSGMVPNLSLVSERLQVADVGFMVNFTKVPYLLNGPIVLHENGFTAQNALLTDRYGNRGYVNGGMKYRHFKEITIDASVDFTNMLCLATTEKDNDTFYGDVFASGRLLATGNFRQAGLDILAKTAKNTTLHIPLSQASEAKQGAFLTFVAPQEDMPKTEILDPLDILRSKERVREPTQLLVTLNAEVTPDAAMMIEINKATGDVINGVGAGVLSIGFDQSRNLFEVFGDYTISSGDYLFILQGILTKKFFITPGGKITFNGDILKTNLDMTAAYRTKASVSTLLADNSAVATLRDVECQIRMTGNMMNPNLDFNIDVADLAPDTRSRVQAAFTPDDKKIRQFMALLVSGSFIPDQQSGIVNNTSILYSNATEILSNQLNNIFGQLNIPLDVGFNYQPGGAGRDIYDVAISTQLFNNRLVVNGNVGNTQAAGATGDVAGNVDIEVKLTDNGNFRVKAFSHSADQYSNYFDMDNTQRNGLGVIYQEEFNTFRELVNRIFGRRKKTEPNPEQL
ncbi:MAG: translocation/assembly module TamB [Bacteroidales bacterium]|nr:translocation/assembly module TamB [Bacteroidales bacterium]